MAQGGARGQNILLYENGESISRGERASHGTFSSFLLKP